jgi:hypothetical protein
MDSLLTYVLEALIVVAIVVIFMNIKLRTPKQTSLPPGPPAEWLVGHARTMPREGQAEFFHEMGKVYGMYRGAVTDSTMAQHLFDAHIGDVTHFKAFKKSIVVLNSAQAATDLLNKRSSIYSDRPRFVMFTNM